VESRKVDQIEVENRELGERGEWGDVGQNIPNYS
jgi:hypothetical protein